MCPYYPKKLEAVGFNVEAFDYHKHIDNKNKESYRFHKDEILYILSKP